MVFLYMENFLFDMKENGCTNFEVFVILLNLLIFVIVIVEFRVYFYTINI